MEQEAPIIPISFLSLRSTSLPDRWPGADNGSFDLAAAELQARSRNTSNLWGLMRCENHVKAKQSANIGGAKPPSSPLLILPIRQLMGNPH